MKEPQKFLDAISTMLSAWGGDTPPEAIWALGDFVEWLNEEYNLELVAPTEDDYYESETFWDKMIIINEAVRNTPNNEG